jgi:UDP-GlcNAc:undecaprenyl-phosphate GlcNAc-1-phosphate transferase
MMLPLLGGLLGAAFVLCVLLTPVVRSAALRWGLVDRPDARRKMHARPVPLAGGVAILLSVCGVLGVALLLFSSLQEAFAEHPGPFFGLFLAAVAICALGVLDDYRCLRGRHKLVGQMLAVALVVGFGVQIHGIHLFGTDLDLGWFSVPVTFLWLLGAVNSLNLLDGMDGMLSTVGAIVMAAMAVMAVLGGHWAAACVAMALAGALLGFLCYNFPPASAFLGDAGSMLTGLVVGVLGIESALKAPATVALAAPLAFLTIPFLDTTAAILRRKLTGRSIYATDRGHLHHCLLRRGLSARRVLLLVSVLCGLTALGGLASLALRNELVAVVAAITVVAILVATRLFGRAEAELFAKRALRLFSSFLQTPGRGKSRQIEVHLQGCADWHELLRTMINRARDLNLRRIRLDVSAPAWHEEYHAEWDRFEDEVDQLLLWRVELPLTVESRTVGRLSVDGFHDGEPLTGRIARIAQLMQEFEAAVSVETVVTAAPTAAARPAQDEDGAKPPHVFDVRRVKLGTD